MGSFGNSNIQTVQGFNSNDDIVGGRFTSPGDAGQITDIYWYGGRLDNGGITTLVKGLVIRDSDKAILGISTPVAPPLYPNDNWYTCNFSSPVLIQPNTDYILGMIPYNYFVRYWGDTTAGEVRIIDGSNSYASPVDPTDATTTSILLSVYCDYILPPSGDIDTINTISTDDIAVINGISVSNIDTINGLTL